MLHMCGCPSPTPEKLSGRCRNILEAEPLPIKKGRHAVQGTHAGQMFNPNGFQCNNKVDVP